MNGSTSAKYDEVNGSNDQKGYLLFPPESGDAVYIALQEYRQSLYPFTLREARCRKQVGPATSVQFSTKVIANLEFMKKLSTDMSGKSTAPAPEQNSQAGQSTETAPLKSGPSFLQLHRSVKCPMLRCLLLLPSLFVSSTVSTIKAKILLQLPQNIRTCRGLLPHLS